MLNMCIHSTHLKRKNMKIRHDFENDMKKNVCVHSFRYLDGKSNSIKKCVKCHRLFEDGKN